jgi:spermidine synthase
MTRTYAGVGVITLATLLLELLLTRIFSVTLYYHFAFMVISLALFGLGLAGVMLYLRPERHPEEQLAAQLASCSRRFAVSLVVSLLYILNHSVTVPLDVTVISRFSWQSIFQLTFLYLFAALPFFYAGMTVSLALYHLRQRVATLYFFDLVGASLACLLLDPLLRGLGGPSAALVVCCLAALAAVIFGRELGSWRPERRSWLLLAATLLLLALNLRLQVIDVGSVKDVHNELLAFSKWNALSRIEVQELGGLPPSMTIDGMARTSLYSLKAKQRPSEHRGIAGLVHVVRPRGRMLIIGPGGGVDVLAALDAGHRDVTLAEINPIILHDVMLGRYREYNGALYAQPSVHPFVAEGRSFVRRSREPFDVIQATLVDTWAATAAGAFALTENHLYTVEAFEDYLEHLTGDGIVTMSRWVQVRGQEFVRLGALARAALERRGVREPQRHVFAAASERLGTLLVKRRPFTDAELGALGIACMLRGYQILYSPQGRHDGPVARVLGPGDVASFYDAFPIDVRPVYDDRPFFFYTVKPDRIGRELFGGPMELNSLSLVVLAALFGIVTLLVLGGIVLPLALGRRRALAGRTASKLRDLGFFVAIGVGYILLEIGLLNRFTLHLGHPTHALRVVLFALLLCSGVGSLLSGRVQTPRGLRWLLGLAGLGVATLTAIYAFVLPPLLHAAIGWTFAGRVVLCGALVGGPGLLMGMMLPTGIRLLTPRHSEIVPWAWGLNGAASVFGSVMAMLLAIHVGFTITLLAGGAMYLLALVAGLRREGGG